MPSSRPRPLAALPALAALATLAVAASVLTGPLVATAAGPGCLHPPLPARVVDPFREPPCPYCAGNRGIEYEPPPGTAVAAGRAGRVTFAAAVAGVRYVVVEHRGGWRTTYGRLATIQVGVGDTVEAGATLGTSTERFFLGLRDGERYVDPAPFLGRLEARPQLVPLDGTHRLAPRAARLVCP